jgi:hypothetical protein
MNVVFARAVLLSVLGFGALAPGAALADDRDRDRGGADRGGRDEVCVYEHAGYGGWEQCFGVGDSIDDLGNRRDQISSVRVRGRAEILFYEHPRFTGRVTEVSSNIPDISRWSRSWNDEVDSLRVGRASFRDRGEQYGQRGQDRVCVYQHADFQGNSQCWDAGDRVRDLKDLGWNDSISSIRTFGRTRVAFYEHNALQGERLLVEGDLEDLSRLRTRDGGSWNDRISSLRIGGGR